MYVRCLSLLQGAIILLLNAALTSCLMGPNFHTPPTPPVQTFTKNPQPEKTVSTPSINNAGKSQQFVKTCDIPGEWWQVFHSPALNNLIEVGLENSPNLAAAKAALVQAQETYNAQVGTALYPSVSAQLGAERQRTTGFGYGTNSAASIFNLYNVSVNVSYTIDFFGAARRELESLRAQIDYERYQLAAAYLTLTSNIVTSAITVASLQAQIDATHRLIASQARQLTIVRQQFRLGGVSGADVYSQESQLAQTQATLPPLEQSLSAANHSLAVLVGEFPGNSQLPQFNLQALNLPRVLPVSLPSIFVKQRPDIQAAEALLHAASAQVGVATANLFPQITLNGNYGWQALMPSALFHPNTMQWSIGGSLLQPVFNGGSLLAKKRAAVAAYQQACAQYKQTVLQAFQNVADTLRALQHDAETLRAQKQSEMAAYKNLQLTERQLKLGGTSYLSLLNAQKQYQQTRISRIQAEASRYLDTAALFQALGGGWWHGRI